MIFSFSRDRQYLGSEWKSLTVSRCKSC